MAIKRKFVDKKLVKKDHETWSSPISLISFWSWASPSNLLLVCVPRFSLLTCASRLILWESLSSHRSVCNFHDKNQSMSLEKELKLKNVLLAVFFSSSCVLFDTQIRRRRRLHVLNYITIVIDPLLLFPKFLLTWQLGVHSTLLRNSPWHDLSPEIETWRHERSFDSRQELRVSLFMTAVQQLKK